MQLPHVVGDLLYGVARGELYPLRDGGVPCGASERAADGALRGDVACRAGDQSGVHVRLRGARGAVVHGGEDRRGGGGDYLELHHEAAGPQRQQLRRRGRLFFMGIGRPLLTAEDFNLIK